jgi:hypothetical protein
MLYRTQLSFRWWSIAAVTLEMANTVKPNTGTLDRICPKIAPEDVRPPSHKGWPVRPQTDPATDARKIISAGVKENSCNLWFPHTSHPKPPKMGRWR